MKEIVKALIAAQKNISDPMKNAANPHFKNKFADLGAHLEAVREPLSEQGLVLMQVMGSRDGKHVLVTRLLHVSGEELSSEFTLELSKNDMQGLGSAITYARRYAISAMFALAAEDDDAEGSVASTKASGAPTKNPSDMFVKVCASKLLAAKTGAEIDAVEKHIKTYPNLSTEDKTTLKQAVSDARSRINA